MAERRASPRVELTVECTLRRRTGSAISATTRDLGPGGMSIRSPRPLATDEVLQFDLPLAPGDTVAGRARVVREQAYGIYALRFEALEELARSRLAGVTA
jgi:hypothetical protein